MAASSTSSSCPYEPNKARGAGCPFAGSEALGVGAPGIATWFPERVDVGVLGRNGDGRSSDPMWGHGFDYASEFGRVDVGALRADVVRVMRTSQAWWPADYGHYGPFFVRLAWHAAGTYRVADGRGGAGAGMLRLAPLNSWPDNANLEKGRRLLWPVKRKYGRGVSWADLMVFAGQVALEEMGLPTRGFAFGREDAYVPEDIYWGPEGEWLAGDRTAPDGDLAPGLGAVQMGLIYVNPEGPGGEPDPAKAAADIRETFGRMGMNDVETVALIAGGHTFGKAHGAAPADAHVGPAPEGAPLAARGLGWASSHGSGAGGDAITSGLEGAWTPTPTQWDSSFFDMLFGFEWELASSPGGAAQWHPVNGGGANLVPDAHVRGRTHPPVMFTTDLALRTDPAYAAISRSFAADTAAFADAFAAAWFKLLHRDMGPTSRYLGPFVPPTTELWQDPLPPPTRRISPADVAALKTALLDTPVAPAALVRAAWASASTFRATDMRGGANGGRVRLEPQVSWAANTPDELRRVLAALSDVQAAFNAGRARVGAPEVSMADLVVLGGVAAVEAAAAAGGFDVSVTFVPGRGDASAAETDAASFAVLEPVADGFRNFHDARCRRAPEHALIDKALLLGLTAPETAVLVGGLRVLGANTGGSALGVLTDRPGVLSTDFFVNILDDSLEWAEQSDGVFVAADPVSGVPRWTASRVDVAFASSSDLRALAEVYAADDGGPLFAAAFAAAFSKVMHLDRFDLSSSPACSRL